MRKRKGNELVGFTLSKEKIKETYNLSPKLKLTWLEEANNFVNKAIKKRKIKEKYN
jgi:hypothetical protein